MAHKLQCQIKGTDLVVDGYRLRMFQTPEPDISLWGRFDNLPQGRYNRRNRMRAAILRQRSRDEAIKGHAPAGG